jgi:hypothetical protein
VSPASLQTFIDTPSCVLENRRLKLTPSVIPNSKYVIMVSDWNCLKYFCVFFLYFNHQVLREFLITLYILCLISDSSVSLTSSSGNSIPTFRYNLKPVPTVCPETSARNYYYSMRNDTEERSSYVYSSIFTHWIETIKVVVRLTFDLYWTGSMLNCNKLQWIVYCFWRFERCSSIWFHHLIQSVRTRRVAFCEEYLLCIAWAVALGS